MRGFFERKGLAFRLVCATTAVVVCVMGAKTAFDVSTQHEWMESSLLERARVIALQQESLWDFMARNQDLINYDDKGNFEYKQLNCSTVAMGVGAMVSSQGEYVIKATNLRVRNPLNEPDGFELAGVQWLKDNPQASEYWDVDMVDGERMMRYMVPLRIGENCLECHGGPAGETDVSGFPKDGLTVGDFAGALSISFPTASYDRKIQEGVMENVLVAVALLAACALIIGLLLNAMVTHPLAAFATAAEKLGRREWDTDLDKIPAHGEVRELVGRFEDMAGQLRELYDDLEGRVAERTEQLARANEMLEQHQAELVDINRQLQETNDFKSSVLAITSHELKAPLASIILFAEMGLKDEHATSEQLRNMQGILKGSRSLLDMINNILGLARIEASKEEMNWDIVDFNDVVLSVEESLGVLAADKGLALSVSVDPDVPLVEGDPEKLCRILQNLVNNSIKFTEPGGTIGVSVRREDASESVAVEVKDSGIGIDEAQQARVFETFTQVDGSTSRRYGGTGLGLALARELAEMHGGTIEVKSKLGCGSVFTVRVPMRAVGEGGM